MLNIAIRKIGFLVYCHSINMCQWFESFVQFLKSIVKVKKQIIKIV